MFSEPDGQPARDLGGLALVEGGRTEPGRVFRAGVRAAVLRTEPPAGFASIIDLRSGEERAMLPHPLATAPGYRHLPLIDPSAEAKRIPSERETLGDIYQGSLRRNARTIAAVLSAAARSPLPLLITCAAGKDRTGMIRAILLELAGVRRTEIEADYTATESADPSAIRQMLEHIDAEHGSIAGYARLLGLGEESTTALRLLLR